MLLRRLPTFAAFAALTALTFAAPSWATDKDVLVIAKAEDPPTADPGVEVSNNGYTLIFPAYERLVKYDGAKTEVIPELAESWTTVPDNLSWTFKLASGHMFDDGSPVDAAAVKYSFDRVKKLAAGPGDMFPTIKDVVIVDPQTVKFELSAPFAPFLSALATSAGSIVNPKAQEHAVNGDDAKAWLAEHSAGSGAFKISGWERNQQITLDPNPHYAGKAPAFKQVIFKIVREMSSRRLQLENGDADLIDQVPVDQAEAMKSSAGVVIESNPSLYVVYLYLNNKKAPFDNPKVRQAISYAADYKGLVDGVMQGQAEQMRGAVPDGMWGHDPQGMQYSYDLEKAKQLLADAGVSNLHISFTYSQADSAWEPVGLALQASLAEIGVTMDMKNVADTTKRELVAKGDYDIATGAWTPDFADPFMFMNIWFDPTKMGAPGNRAFYENPKVTDLITQALATVDQKKREQLYIDAQKITNEDAPYVLLFQKNDIFAMRSSVKGYIYNPMLIQVYNIADMSKSE
ncbi:MAG: ABC transporter substrate-binding protein [Mesorhizobium sp.]|uniref:ABC transporter substrate-binding protein n=1 Tax=Mesorhizobium sp. TaxID=1871066 RepID=UPI00121B9607|nr:ABC transporter substrate-binding protein [Mesorhizobium sp.]TIT38324.1 MAG: ABC transporter substrate-binding protein [Mesorhizobium sp.]